MSNSLEDCMKQLREHWSWPTAVAPLVFGIALTLVIVSCSRQASPISPSSARVASTAVEVPDPSPGPSPDPSPGPSPDPSPEPSPEPSPSPGGGEGCTPGYWKQPQHFDSWTAPYDPSDTFLSAFGVNAFPGMTLLEVLSNGGGGLDALGRHAVAALLSAASSGVDYDLSVAQVIAGFNAAFASGDYETQKNIFAGFNEQGCPLN
jgi:hypothetical protein